MAKVLSSPYLIPPAVEKANQIYQQLHQPTADYMALVQRLAEVNTPATTWWSQLSDQFHPAVLTGLQEAQRAYDMLRRSGALEAMERQQAIWSSMLTPYLQTQAETWTRDWSRDLLRDLPTQPDRAAEQRSEEVSRLAELAEQYGNETPPPAEITEEDQRLASAEVEKLLCVEQNREQQFAAQLKQWSETHPVVAWLLEKFFYALLIGVLTNLTSSGVGHLLTNARVYEEPKTTAQVVYHIPQGQTVTVLGQVPYYYEIETQDAATGARQSGYVSKRSVRLEPQGEPANPSSK